MDFVSSFAAHSIFPKLKTLCYFVSLCLKIYQLNSYQFVVLTLIIVGSKEYLIKKTRLLILYAQFTVNSCQYALHLSKGKHAAKEGISGIVAARLVAKHCHAMVNAHWQVWILLLKYACQLNYVGTAAKMRSFGKVAVGENVA